MTTLPIQPSSTEALQRVFEEQNPWHADGEVPSTLAREIERPLAQRLWSRLLGAAPVRFQLVLGPRRVGKTTALYQTVRHLIAEGVDPTRIWWLRLDHPLLMQERLGDLVRMVVETVEAIPEQPVFLMLDELVYAEAWDLWLKTFFDDQWPVRIAATSSATAALRERRLESGVGRWAEQHLTPYLFPEFLDLIGHPAGPVPAATLAESLEALPRHGRSEADIAQRRSTFMLVGGFPELLTALRHQPTPDEADQLLESQQVLRSDAVERAIYKDIPQSFRVENPMMLERLLYTLAGQITGVLSPSTISKELGITQPTLDRYLSYLERTFLIFTLPNYSGREATVQKRGRKIFFFDGAIRNAALQRGLAPLDDPAERGALIENLAASTLRALAVHGEGRLHHWRDGNKEVDLVLDHPEAPLAFEIASSPQHRRTGLRAFMDRHARFRGACYLVTPQATVLPPAASDDAIGTLPLDRFLTTVGAQAQQALERRLGRTATS